MTSPVIPSIFFEATIFTKKAVKKETSAEIENFRMLKYSSGVENSNAINQFSLKEGKNSAPSPVLFAGFEMFINTVIEYLAKTEA